MEIVRTTQSPTWVPQRRVETAGVAESSATGSRRYSGDLELTAVLNTATAIARTYGVRVTTTSYPANQVVYARFVGTPAAVGSAAARFSAS